MNGHKVEDLDWQAEVIRKADKLAYPVSYGIFDPFTQEDDDSDSTGFGDSITGEKSNTPIQQKRMQIDYYLNRIANSFNKTGTDPIEYTVKNLNYYCGTLDRSLATTDGTELPKGSYLKDIETGRFHGPFRIPDEIKIPDGQFMYRVGLLGDEVFSVDIVGLACDYSVFESMVKHLDSDADTRAIYNEVIDRFRSETGATLSVTEPSVSEAIDVDDDMAMIAAMISSTSTHTNGLNVQELVRTDRFRHEFQSRVMDYYTLDNERARYWINSHAWILFFCGKPLARISRFLPYNIISKQICQYCSKTSWRNDMKIVEAEFKKNPVRFCFPETYVYCTRVHSLKGVQPNFSDCLPLDVAIETIVDYGLCGELVAPNYKLLAVLIYTLARYAFERENHTIVTYDYLVRSIRKWMESPKLKPRTERWAFWYGNLKCTPDDRVIPVEIGDWPLSRSWFEDDVKGRILQALEYGSSKEAGECLVSIHDTVKMDFSVPSPDIDTNLIRVYWSHVYQLEAMVLFAAYIMQRRLERRVKNNDPLPLRAMVKKNYCSEQLNLLEMALGYRENGPTGFPVAPFIVNEGQAGSGKTQVMYDFAQALDDQFMAMSQQHNQKGNLKSKFKEVLIRATTIMKCNFDHGCTCRNFMEGYAHRMLDAEASLSLATAHDKKMANVVLNCNSTNTDVFGTAVRDYGWPYEKCMLENLLVVYYEEAVLIPLRNLAVSLFNLATCSQTCVVIFGGDPNQLPAVGGGNVYKGIAKFAPTSDMTHPHRSGQSDLTVMCKQISQGVPNMSFVNPMTQVIDYFPPGRSYLPKDKYIQCMAEVILDLHVKHGLTLMNTQIIAYSNSLCFFLGSKLGYAIRHGMPKLPTSTTPILEVGQKVQAKKTIIGMDLCMRVTYVVRCILHLRMSTCYRYQKTNTEPTKDELRVEAAKQYVIQQRVLRRKKMVSVMLEDPKKVSEVILNSSSHDWIAPDVDESPSCDGESELPAGCFSSTPKMTAMAGTISVAIPRDGVKEILRSQGDEETNPKRASFLIQNVVSDTSAYTNTRGGDPVVKVAVLSVFYDGMSLNSIPRAADVRLVPILPKWSVLKDATTITVHSGQGSEFSNVIQPIAPKTFMTKEALYSASTRVINPKAVASDGTKKPVLFFVARPQDLRGVLVNSSPPTLSMTGTCLNQMKQLPLFANYPVRPDYLDSALLEAEEDGIYGQRPATFKSMYRKQMASMSDEEFNLHFDDKLHEFQAGRKRKPKVSSGSTSKRSSES